MDAKDLEPVSVKQMPVRKVSGFAGASVSDTLSVEEPLEIRIGYGPAAGRMQKNISVTMRTPGHDAELATGFLFTEGILSSQQQILGIRHAELSDDPLRQNSIRVELAENLVPLLAQTDRNFYTTSSCGVCGKGSIQSIKTVSPFAGSERPSLTLSIEQLYRMPAMLRAAQGDFSATGGIHASGLFDIGGELLLVREDVGRHNALDKLIGSALTAGLLPLSHHVLLLSGRASFELIQKAAMAGIPVVAAIGAPSSLAVDLARESDITLIGFLKENRFNIYHTGRQLSIPHLL